MGSGRLSRFLRNSSGASGADYGIIVGLVAIIAIGAVTATGDALFDIYEQSADNLEGGGKANENASDRGQEQSGNSVPDIIDVIAPPDGVYRPGDALQFTIVFSKKVNVKENTYVEIDIGGEVRRAYYKAGSGTNDIVFEYVVTEEDIDTDGIEFEQPGVGGENGAEDGVSDGETGGDIDGDFTGEEPDMGGIILPGPQECQDACLYVAFATGEVRLVGEGGATVWSNTDQKEDIYALAVDADGFVYTAGEDGSVRKLKPTGGEVWMHQTGNDVMRAVAVGPDGTVYAGSGTGSTVYKLNGETGGVMAVEWVFTDNPDQKYRDLIEGIAVDKYGYPFVSTKYGALAKLDPAGEMTTLWKEEMPTDYLDEIQLDLSGNIYVGGYTYDYSEDDSYRDDAVYVISDNGSSRTIVNRADTVNGQIFNMDLGPDGIVAVAASKLKSPFTYTVSALTPGEYKPEKWSFSDFPIHVRDVSFDGLGHIYAGSGSQISKLDVDTGTEVERFILDAGITEIEAYAPGVNTGPTEGGGQAAGPACTANCIYAAGADGRVMSLGQDGSVIWTNTDQTETVYELALGPDGSIHTAGADGTVRKIGTDGAQIWSHDAVISDMMDVAVASDGTVFAVGKTGMVRKLSADGRVLATEFVRTTNPDQRDRDWVNGVDVGADGMVYVATKFGAVAKIDPAGDMTVLWNDDVPSDYLDDVAIGDDGKIYVAGHTFDYSQDDMYKDDAAYVIVDAGSYRYIEEDFDQVSGQVFSMALSPSGKIAVASTKMKSPWVYHLKQFTPGEYYPQDWDFTGSAGHLADLQYDAAGDLWAAGRDSTVRKIDGATGTVELEVNLGTPIYGIAVSD